ncbi:predicted Zn-dependent peptidase [Bacteroidales bacterium 6E]|nr:predicted Zn-dependent peptidase [Bacteroidales bacterium 6E]
MMKRKNNIYAVFGLMLTGFILMVSPVSGQQPPMDPAIRTGKLANGLTYYIRHSEEPKERASFYIIQNVGALLENDNQDGLAHFLEHMAFNGTKNFPGKGIIHSLERHGVAFGRNINAYTSQNETVYNLSDVPVKAPGLIDTCLLILHDWSDFLLLTDEEIDLERGVISEEWRTRRNASFRMQRQFFPVLFKDSKYAVRDVIGNLDVIKNFDYATLRSFYHDWYRTDLQAIAVAGDIDVDEMEQKIIKLFSGIKAVENAPEREFITIPYHGETLFTKAADPEATSSSVAIYVKFEGTKPENKDLSYLRDSYAANLFNRMMSDRINEILQRANPPFMSGSISFGGFARGYDIMAINATAHPNRMEDALKAIYAEALRVKLHGFTEPELDRAKRNILSMMENQWKQQDKIRNDQHIRKMQAHYLQGEPLISVDFEWEYLQEILPGITVEEVSEMAKNRIRNDNRVIIVTGPEKEDIRLLDEEIAFAIMSEVENSTLLPYEEQDLGNSLISEELKGASVVSTRRLDELQAVEWTLSNNAKVVYKHADFQKDNVILQAFSPGGNSVLDTDKLPSAAMLGNFMGSFGMGDFDATALRRMLAGKNVGINSSLTSLYETFRGNSSPRDFETLLQLLYLSFEHPRFEEEAYEAMRMRLQAAVANMSNNPQKIMSDTLQKIMSGYSERTLVVTPALFDQFNLASLEEVYRDRFKDAGDFIFFIVGNIEEENARTLAARYIGSLTDDPRSENWVDDKIRFPQGQTKKQIPITLQTEKANVTVALNKLLEYSPSTNLMLDVLQGVLRLRYTEEIREKEGGTYGVSVNAYSERYPLSQKSVVMNFDTDPERADHLKSILYREMEKIAAEGPTLEDFDKVVKNILKDREQAKPNNGYWMSVLINYYQKQYNSDAPENYEEILAKMTREDIRKFTAEFLKGADVVDVVFIPQK